MILGIYRDQVSGGYGSSPFLRYFLGLLHQNVLLLPENFM